MNTSNGKDISKRVPLLICAFIIFGTLAVYRQATEFPFIDLDDGPYVYLNSHVQSGITLKSMEWAFTTFHCSNWHPVTWLSHMLDCQLHGLNPTGHHFTSLLLHIINALLLFALLRRMTGAVWRSGFVAAVFALHPLHVESVAWVAERKDVLSTFFMLLTILAYLRYSERRSIGRYLLVAGAFALGLMAKPMLVSVPILLLMLDWWPLGLWDRRKLAPSPQPSPPGEGEGTTSPSPSFLRRGTGICPPYEGGLQGVWEKAPLFVMAAGSCVITYLAQRMGGATQSFEYASVGVRAANAVVAYFGYIVKMIWPRDLAVLYPHPGNTIPTWQVIVCGILLPAITFAAIQARRKYPYIAVGWLWYVVTLIPVIGLVQVGGQGMADRYTYIPMIGLLIAVVWGISDLAASKGKSAMLAAPAIAVLIPMMMVTTTQVGYWRDTGVLLNHALDSTGGHYLIRCWIADHLIKQGKTDEAIALLSRSLNDRPGVAQVHNALGCLLADKGGFDEAKAHLEEAIRLKPGSAEAYNNLGTIFAKQGMMDAAIGEFRKAIRLHSFYAEAHFNLGAALAVRGEIDEAIREFQEAAMMNPENAEARCRAGVLLNAQGKGEEAISEFRSAVEIDPKLAEGQFLLGDALLKQGNVDEAVTHLSAAVRIKKDWGLAHGSLAVALYGKGDYREAWREVQIAEKCGYRPGPAFVKELKERIE